MALGELADARDATLDRWVGGILASGGLAILGLSALADTARMVSAGLCLMGYGAIVIWRARRHAAVPARCTHCTLRIAHGDTAASCEACGARLHAGCAASHARVYHDAAHDAGGPYRKVTRPG